MRRSLCSSRLASRAVGGPHRRSAELVDPGRPRGESGTRDHQLATPPVPHADGVLVVAADGDEKGAVRRKLQSTDRPLVKRTDRVASVSSELPARTAADAAALASGREAARRRLPRPRRRGGVDAGVGAARVCGVWVRHPSDSADFGAVSHAPDGNPRTRPGPRRSDLSGGGELPGRVKRDRRHVIVVAFVVVLSASRRVVNDAEGGGGEEQPSVAEGVHL